MKIKSFEWLKSIRNYEKKYLERQTLGQPTWPSEPVYYYIVDCRINEQDGRLQTNYCIRTQPYNIGLIFVLSSYYA